MTNKFLGKNEQPSLALVEKKKTCQLTFIFFQKLN